MGQQKLGKVQSSRWDDGAKDESGQEQPGDQVIWGWLKKEGGGGAQF